MLCKGLMARKRGGTSVVLVASGSALLRSTSIRDRYQVGSSAVATFQSGSSLKLNSKTLRPLFSPTGHTIHPPHCSSFHTCNWSR